jgi:hypothetical protein
VGPRYRHFHDFEVELLSEVKQFGIEAPAFDSLHRKNCGSGSPVESFESALCVFEIQTQRSSQHQIENSPEDLPVDWLPLSLQIAA